MLKSAKKSDRELHARAVKILRAQGITKADYIRSALNAVIEAPAAAKLGLTVQVKPQLRRAANDAGAPRLSAQERGKRIKALQAQVKRFLGSGYQPLTEEEKKEIADDISGGL